MKLSLILGLVLILSIPAVAEQTWKPQNVYIIESSSLGGYKLSQKLKSYGISTSILGGYGLIYGIEKYISGIESLNSIIILKPSSEDFNSLKEVWKRHPNLLPLEYNETLYYHPPFMYFAYKDGKVRGIVVCNKLPDSFAEQLIKGIPLNKAFWYENGEIKYILRLKEPWNPDTYVPPGWKLLVGEHFRIFYKEGYKNDADLMLRFAENARKVVMKVYPHNISSKVTVYLHTLQDYDRSPSVAYTNSQSLEIHFLTPSEQSDSWYDSIWYKKNMIHEYAHIPFYKDLDSKTEGYKSVPNWLSEGFAEYCAIFGSNDKVIENRYQNNLNKVKEMVKNGEGYLIFVCENIYYGGAYIVKYMYETYGQRQVY